MAGWLGGTESIHSLIHFTFLEMVSDTLAISQDRQSIKAHIIQTLVHLEELQCSAVQCELVQCSVSEIQYSTVSLLVGDGTVYILVQ